MIKTVFYIARVFPEMNLEQAINKKEFFIKKDFEINHVQAYD